MAMIDKFIRLTQVVRNNYCALSYFLHLLKQKYKHYGWPTLQSCQEIPWSVSSFSRKGFPLIYTTFGKGNNTTLFLGGVHPDEITPIHISFVSPLISTAHISPSAVSRGPIRAPLWTRGRPGRPRASIFFSLPAPPREIFS